MISMSDHLRCNLSNLHSLMLMIPSFAMTKLSIVLTARFGRTCSSLKHSTALASVAVKDIWSIIRDIVNKRESTRM